VLLVKVKLKFKTWPGFFYLCFLVLIVLTFFLIYDYFLVGGRGGGSADNAWAYRDVMLRPWQEFVTHRLVLKKIGAAGSGGGGGGGGNSHQGHVAKWIKPEVSLDDRFRVDNVGIVASLG
jgi:hypothetical protein